ncbi:type II toxin-antitoxin system RelE/ParE family toxin [Patescibacteria group bacterium]|nr:type II toxin-antitoxin system RelE/ParE family toxin [Patescibacteria group bacterium]
MVYKVLLDKPADKSLGKLNSKIKEDILVACTELEHFSEKTRNTKKLKHPFVGFRRRVGKYRILFLVNKKNIEIYKIGLRKDIYKN